jgi:hypothetical protein
MQQVRTVDADTLRIPFAIDPAGKHLRAVDIVTHRRDLRCPGCRTPVQWRRESRKDGKVARVSHFAHQANAACKGAGWEGMAHAELKLATIAIIRKHGHTHVVNWKTTGKWPAEPTPETPYPGTAYVADVGLKDETGDRFIGLEIIATSEISTEKRRSVLSRPGVMMFSLDAKPFAKLLEDTANDHTWNVELKARDYVFSAGFNLVTMPLTRNVIPSDVTVIGGAAINCDRELEIDPDENRITAARSHWEAQPKSGARDMYLLWIKNAETYRRKA